jgi:2-polyprenyl-3-methyl-5-hydroxy-6-metoxy-1,4-benzoquinol methylase
MDNFDWKKFFSQHINSNKQLELVDKQAVNILQTIRGYLSENNVHISFVLTDILRELLQDITIEKSAEFIELGAATGILSRWLVNEYSGHATLVDNCEKAYQLFTQIGYCDMHRYTYILEDLFQFSCKKRYQIVSSFGLIEHFKDKRSILAKHKELLSDNGYAIILVPKNTLLTKVYFDCHPELNHGYRELLNQEKLHEVLELAGLNVIKILSSRGYSYDFLVSLSQKVRR